MEKKKITTNKKQVTKKSKNAKKNMFRPSEKRERVRRSPRRASPLAGGKFSTRSTRSNNTKTDSWEKQKKRWYLMIGGIMLGVFLVNVALIGLFMQGKNPVPAPEVKQEAYWFMLHRKSEKEYLYQGVPGDVKRSQLLKIFPVKVGIPGERPTPLPQLMGRKYWRIIDKVDSSENPETAPYFLELDVPAPTEAPYGPAPYTECGGEQCDWQMPGEFGLHGIASNAAKLADEDPGSSGCIRHRDEDITYLYQLLDPKKEEIRYYIEDI